MEQVDPGQVANVPLWAAVTWSVVTFLASIAVAYLFGDYRAMRVLVKREEQREYAAALSGLRALRHAATLSEWARSMNADLDLSKTTSAPKLMPVQIFEQMLLSTESPLHTMRSAIGPKDLERIVALTIVYLQTAYTVNSLIELFFSPPPREGSDHSIGSIGSDYRYYVKQDIRSLCTDTTGLEVHLSAVVEEAETSLRQSLSS